MAHCLVLPALLLALPALTVAAAGSERAHGWLFAFAIGAAVPALALGYRRHRDAATVLVAAAGFALLATGAIFGEAVETAMTISGSVAILVAHRRNLRLRHRHQVRC